MTPKDIHYVDTSNARNAQLYICNKAILQTMVDTKELRYNFVYESHLGDHCQEECMSTYSVKGQESLQSGGQISKLIGH